MVYRPIPRAEILDALVHLRELYRQIKPSSERELLAYERREAATRDLLSNLPRVNQHPTLRTLLEVADIFQLTLDGAHRLFGYHLDRIREYDLGLNGGRTHVIESYPFGRDLSVDLPSELASREAFSNDALLQNLVGQWRTDVPIRALEEKHWNRPDRFYVHVGTEDSLGLNLPPGALAMVTPVDVEERKRPNPRWDLSAAVRKRISMQPLCGHPGKTAPVHDSEDLSWPRGVHLSRRRTDRRAYSNVCCKPSGSGLSLAEISTSLQSMCRSDLALGTSNAGQVTRNRIQTL